MPEGPARSLRPDLSGVRYGQPMIRHVVLFRWTEQATGEQKQQMEAQVARLPSLVPSLRAFHAGTDLGVNQGNFDFAAAADFDDLDGYLAYRDHPDHRAIVSQFILPIAAQRAAVQYEF
jgi:Stress responsive A/B Barrel Domain